MTDIFADPDHDAVIALSNAGHELADRLPRHPLPLGRGRPLGTTALRRARRALGALHAARGGPRTALRRVREVRAMSGPRIGSMFSGVGGLDIAVAAATGGKTVFVADVCKVDKNGNVGHYEPHRAPCSVLAHRFPGVPNLGDVSLIDWSPWRGLVEIICAGFPCQDVSVAGGRKGLREGTRTGLWSQVVRAITELQPRLVVLENVPGIFTAPAAGDVEPCPWCLGDGPDGYAMRALDAVLADLASIGFDADWTVVPASGVGAAHKRERWFCAAYPAGQPWRFEHGDGGAAADAGHRAADRERSRSELGQGSGAVA